VTGAELARSLNLSPSRFAHLFRKEIGVAPMRYLHTQRMLRARLLLEQTFLSVKQVMVEVGCSDPSHFARDFQRFHGLSPTQWRAAVRARDTDDRSTPV
jgi:AraC family transcriptional regulator, arabinose operon regulatory protein